MSMMMDVHNLWVTLLPQTFLLRVLYFSAGYAIIAFGIALANRCKMPIAPTDLFPRELADITKIPYSKIKVAFDVCCLSFTAVLGLVFLHHLAGLGIGTVIAALTTGKAVGAINRWMAPALGIYLISRIQRKRLWIDPQPLFLSWPPEALG